MRKLTPAQEIVFLKMVLRSVFVQHKIRFIFKTLASFPHVETKSTNITYYLL